jgi:hypothetical protein
VTQSMMQRRTRTVNPQPAPSRLRRQRLLEAVLALLVVPAVLGGESLSAQSQAPQATLAQQQKVAAKPASEAIVVQSSASPPSIWPANQPPRQARVSWDGRGLEIEASNSSLDQILRQVAAETGAKLEGLTQDQRVFGSYGPGPVSDVILKLLDGSSYNVLIIGRHDADAPLEIVLSARSPANPQTAANNQSRSNSKNDEAVEQFKPEPPPDDPAKPPGSQAVQDPFNNGGPPRETMQFMQEILQRQQKIDQQQQQQQDQQNRPQQ